MPIELSGLHSSTALERMSYSLVHLKKVILNLKLSFWNNQASTSDNSELARQINDD